MARGDPRTYFVYILEVIEQNTRKKKFYTGLTINLEARVRQHQNGKARYTRGKQPKLLYFEKLFGTWIQARKREKQIKKLSQKQKEVLIIKKRRRVDR